MSSKSLVVVCFVLTFGAIALYPIYKSSGAESPLPPVRPVPTDLRPAHLDQPPRPKIEVVFALDTTGSMGGMIEAAKEKIWSIATTLAQSQPAPEIRMGLVAFRDRGDDYVTRVTDLSTDLDALFVQLMDLRAGGGGDGPESVNQALHDAVHAMSWSDDESAYRVVFLVGDAPPHMDYQNDVKFPETLAAAARKGIVVNAIQCGRDAATQRHWQQIAQLGAGSYFEVDQRGSAVAIATPFDAPMAELAAELDETQLYYGSAEDLVVTGSRIRRMDKVHAEASLTSRARRAAFKATPSGAVDMFGEGDLVEDLASGSVSLDSVAAAALPAPMQAMSPEEQAAFVAETAARRDELKRELAGMATERDAYLRQTIEAQGGAADSLDDKLFEAVRSQAADKGFAYDAAAPVY